MTLVLVRPYEAQSEEEARIDALLKQDSSLTARVESTLVYESDDLIVVRQSCQELLDLGLFAGKILVLVPATMPDNPVILG